MTEEVIVGKEVVHSKYGAGIVLKMEDSYMTIQFSNDNVKQFRYPDAFESFLSIEDTVLLDHVQKDLCNRQNEPDYLKRKKADELYQNMKEFDKKKATEWEAKKTTAG